MTTGARKTSLSPSILLVLLSGLLALVLAGIVAAYSLARWSPPEPLAPEIPRIKATAPVAEAGTDISTLLAAPPFWASRRPDPFPQNATQVEEAETVSKDTQLLGLYGSGRDAGALILIGGKIRRISKGDTLAGWIVQDIQPRSIVLANSRGQRKEIPLLHAKQAVGSAKARATAQAAHPNDTQGPATGAPKP